MRIPCNYKIFTQQEKGMSFIFWPKRKLPKSLKVQSSGLQQLLKGCEDSSLRLRQGLLEAQFLLGFLEIWNFGGWSNHQISWRDTKIPILTNSLNLLFSVCSQFFIQLCCLSRPPKAVPMPQFCSVLWAMINEGHAPVMMYFLDNGIYNKFTYGNMNTFLKNMVIRDETYWTHEVIHSVFVCGFAAFGALGRSVGTAAGGPGGTRQAWKETQEHGGVKNSVWNVDLNGFKHESIMWMISIGESSILGDHTYFEEIWSFGFIISVHWDAAKSDFSGVFLAVEFTVNSQPQLSERYWYDSDLTVDYLSFLFVVRPLDMIE